MRLKSQKLFEINSSLEKLFSQQVDLPLSVGYAVFKKKKEIQDICQYIADRISMVIPAEHMQSNELNEDELKIYNMILNSEIDIEPFDISADELFSNNKVSLTLKEITDIMELFPKN